MRRRLPRFVLLLLFLVNTSYAPVPFRDALPSFIIINKIPESSSFMNSFNPYFPVLGTFTEKVSQIICNHFYLVLECEYGGPLQAVLAGDFPSVSLLADVSWKIPR